MLVAIVIILIILWFLGYVPIIISGIAIPNPILFYINSRPITLWEILILIAISWAIGILPNPLRVIGSVLLILWILSVLGIIAISGFSHIIVLVIIIGLIISIFI